jgi:hypothetical protein
LGAREKPTVHLSVVATVVAGQNDDFIFRCLTSALAGAAAGCELRVTAVDNSPGLGLAARLRGQFPGITVLENPVRRGFAANHNAALRASTADYYLITNDDVVFPEGTIARGVEFLERSGNDRVGIVGFRLVNPDGSLQPCTYKFPTVRRALLELAGVQYWVPFRPWTLRVAAAIGRGGGRSRFWPHDRTLPVDTFRGAVMLVRGAAAREIGPMDEVSMIGGEETEWHRRFWDRGWKVVFLHDVSVIHHGSQTLRVSPDVRAEYLKGLLSYFGKHRGAASLWAFRALATPLLVGRLVAHAITGDRVGIRVTRELLRTVLWWKPPAAR